LHHQRTALFSAEALCKLIEHRSVVCKICSGKRCECWHCTQRCTLRANNDSDSRCHLHPQRTCKVCEKCERRHFVLSSECSWVTPEQRCGLATRSAARRCKQSKQIMHASSKRTRIDKRMQLACRLMRTVIWYENHMVRGRVGHAAQGAQRTSDVE
jgi:hypothetical protein